MYYLPLISFVPIEESFFSQRPHGRVTVAMLLIKAAESIPLNVKWTVNSVGKGSSVSRLLLKNFRVNNHVVRGVSISTALRADGRVSIIRRGKAISSWKVQPSLREAFAKAVYVLESQKCLTFPCEMSKYKFRDSYVFFVSKGMNAVSYVAWVDRLGNVEIETERPH